MVKLSKNDRISIYGNLNINTISNKVKKNICISFENKRVCLIGDYLYDFLQKEYEKINYDWMDNNVRIKTMKISINNEILKNKSIVNISGFVEDNRGIPGEDGKKYAFKITNIFLEDLFKELENLYDEYICEFDTIKSGLKIRIEDIKFE